MHSSAVYARGKQRAEQDYIRCPDCGDVILNTLHEIDQHIRAKEYRGLI